MQREEQPKLCKLLISRLTGHLVWAEGKLPVTPFTRTPAFASLFGVLF